MVLLAHLAWTLIFMSSFSLVMQGPVKTVETKDKNLVLLLEKEARDDSLLIMVVL